MDNEPSPDQPFWLREESFWTPTTLVESAWHQNAPTAFWIVAAMEPRTIVELGVHNGFSYLCFCQAVDRLGLTSRCFGVDTWEGDAHSGFYGEEVLAELRTVHDPFYGRFSRLVPSTFDAAVDQFDDGSIDLLHIDGRHFKEDVEHDFETWLPKLSDQSVALFHDITVRERGFGVHRFWENLTDRYPTFSFRHDNGLGVALVGNAVAEPLAHLTGLDDARSEVVRQAYQRLGQAVSAEWHRTDLGVQVEQLRSQAIHLEAQVVALSQNTNDERQFRDAQASRLHEALTDNQVLREEIVVLREEIVVLRLEIANIHDKLSDEATKHESAIRDIDDLRSERENLRSSLATTATELTDALAKITRLSDELNTIYESRSWKVASVMWRAHG